jgi:hypothetical protein
MEYGGECSISPDHQKNLIVSICPANPKVGEVLADVRYDLGPVNVLYPAKTALRLEKIPDRSLARGPLGKATARWQSTNMRIALSELDVFGSYIGS